MGGLLAGLHLNAEHLFSFETKATSQCARLKTSLAPTPGLVEFSAHDGRMVYDTCGGGR
jgi:hypothetical protein